MRLTSCYTQVDVRLFVLPALCVQIMLVSTSVLRPRRRLMAEPTQQQRAYTYID